MANVLIFDKQNNKVLHYLNSVHTPDYIDRDDAVINPVLPQTNIKYMRVNPDSKEVIELKQIEKDAVDVEEAAVNLAAKKEQLKKDLKSNPALKLAAKMLIDAGKIASKDELYDYLKDINL